MNVTPCSHSAHVSSSDLKMGLRCLCHLNILENVLTGKHNHQYFPYPLSNWSWATSGDIAWILGEILLMSIKLLLAYTLWHMLFSHTLIVPPWAPWITLFLWWHLSSCPVLRAIFISKTNCGTFYARVILRIETWQISMQNASWVYCLVGFWILSRKCR